MMILREETPVDIQKNEVSSADDENKIFEKVKWRRNFRVVTQHGANFLKETFVLMLTTENGAPDGQFTIWVLFVVDKEGNVSDLKALTNHGYGMEDEAVRVIKKGPQWKPTIQNGRNVKAYRKQSITFINVIETQ